jgi:hypothetical protein
MLRHKLEELRHFAEEYIALVESRFGKRKIRVKFYPGDGAWIRHRVITIGAKLLKSKKDLKFILLHECGHVYGRSRKEIVANRWLFKYIHTYDRKLEKNFWNYINMCLNFGPGMHSQDAINLVKELQYDVIKTSNNKLIVHKRK